MQRRIPAKHQQAQQALQNWSVYKLLKQQNKRTEGVVDTEVETTVDDDTNNGGDEATIETSNTIRGKGLPVDIDETVELTSSSTLSRLGVVGKTGTGVIEGVDEEQG